jgi:hypothetical protein
VGVELAEVEAAVNGKRVLGAEPTLLEKIDGWDRLSPTKRKFLWARPKWSSRAQTAREIGTSIGYINKEIYGDPVFKRAVKAREAGRVPGRIVEIDDLARLAYDEIYDMINAPRPTKPAMEKVRMETARWVLGTFLKQKALVGTGDPKTEQEDAAGGALTDLGLPWAPHPPEKKGSKPNADSPA